MASQRATIQVTGNLAFPPDVGNGGRVKLRVLSNRGYFDRQLQVWVEKGPTGFDVICWGDLGANAAASLHRGDPVIVIGRLDETTWTDSSGVVHRGVEVTADAIGPDLAKGQTRFSKTLFSTTNEQTQAVHTNALAAGSDDPWTETSESTDSGVDHVDAEAELVGAAVGEPAGPPY